MSEFRSILIVGCGNMGGAMLAGWLAAGADPQRFTLVDPALDRSPEGVALLREVPEVGEFEAILLGVKPQMLAEVAPRVAPLVGRGTIVLSILAGVELETLASSFSGAAAIVRIMPNLAAALGKSPIGVIGAGLSDQPAGKVDALLEPLGTVEWLEDEKLMDVVTALAGSGPAFVYRFIDALAAGGAELGLPREQADRLALAMVEGAAALAAHSDLTPDDLARKVTSPGGTTQAGLAVLDSEDSLSGLVLETLRAARDRGAEMAAEARRNR
jgi:pyrroline-5-carboxylate reductase